MALRCGVVFAILHGGGADNDGVYDVRVGTFWIREVWGYLWVLFDDFSLTE
jgi:hypothetical protein